MIPEQTLLNFPVFGDNATKVEPDNNMKSNGWRQSDIPPFQYMNWEWYHASKGVSDLNKGVTSMEKEINNVLSSFGITPAELTNNQLLTALRLNASFVTANSTTVTGPLLVSGGTIRVLFTAAITGSDTTTGLSLTYNNQSIAVKVNKNGAKENFVANEVSSGTYKYLQAYTTLELVYDGVDFLIVGNPVVLSGSNYAVYADGKKEQKGLRLYTSTQTVTFNNQPQREIVFDVPYNSTNYIVTLSFKGQIVEHIALPNIKKESTRVVITLYTQGYVSRTGTVDVSMDALYCGDGIRWI